MAGKRVVLGQQNDGTMGLRVSKAGVDAFVGDGQDGGFTFNSDWTDLTRIHLVGIGMETLVSSFWRIRVDFTDLGYKPFFEARRFESGNIIRDDYWGYSAGGTSGVLAASGAYHNLTSNTHLEIGFSNAVGPSPSGTGYKALYVIYRVPVASG